MFMPFELGTYRQLWRLALAERRSGAMSRRRRCVVFPVLLALPILTFFNAVFFALDNLLFPGIHRVKVRRPVFIIGHARSGTSLMHRLMTCDERSFVYFRMYEMFLPALTQKYIVRAGAWLDRRLFGSRGARALRAWEDRTFAKGRQMHPMSLAGPEEDEFLLALSCASGVWETLFPYPKELEGLYYFDELPVRRRHRILGFYRACLKRQLWLYGRERVHCSKNPVFTGKVASLVEAFPDARFILMSRDPAATIPSLLKMMERNWLASDCDRSQIRRALVQLAEQSYHSYSSPPEVFARHPGVEQVTVDYEQLVAQPRATVERTYQALGMAVSEEFAAVLDSEEARSRQPRAAPLYMPEEIELSADENRRRCGISSSPVEKK